MTAYIIFCNNKFLIKNSKQLPKQIQYTVKHKIKNLPNSTEAKMVGKNEYKIEYFHSFEDFGEFCSEKYDELIENGCIPYGLEDDKIEKKSKYPGLGIGFKQIENGKIKCIIGNCNTELRRDNWARHFRNNHMNYIDGKVLMDRKIVDFERPVSTEHIFNKGYIIRIPASGGRVEDRGDGFFRIYFNNVFYDEEREQNNPIIRRNKKMFPYPLENYNTLMRISDGLVKNPLAEIEMEFLKSMGYELQCQYKLVDNSKVKSHCEFNVPEFVPWDDIRLQLKIKNPYFLYEEKEYKLNDGVIVDYVEDEEGNLHKTGKVTPMEKPKEFIYVYPHCCGLFIEEILRKLYNMDTYSESRFHHNYLVPLGY